MIQTIVGHVSPDWDCIGALWMLQRYGGLAGAAVAFVNTGHPDLDLLAAAAAVVDTGREYDPRRLRFDHHHLPGAEASASCATEQVYHWLVIARPNVDWTYLGGLVALIHAGDTGKPAADLSRRLGIHALLSARKARKETDAELLAWGYSILDDLAAESKARHDAADMLAAHFVYISADGLLLAIKGAPPHATSAAFDQGARLVLFQNDSPETNAIGVMRSGEWQQPHLKELILGILNDAECDAPGSIRWDSAEYIELASWYLHEAGFFAGRGTQKAPDRRPITAQLLTIARVLDFAWKR